MDKKVDREIINDAVKTAVYSPSWLNTQPIRFTVIDDKVKKADFSGKVFLFEKNVITVNDAAGVIIISYKKGMSGFTPDGKLATEKGETWGMFDAGVAVQTLSLALYEKGIGSVIMGLFDVDKASDLISLPDDEVIVALLPYGYPDSKVKMPSRKDFSEIIRYQD